MAFPTSQQLYNVNFCTGARVSVETKLHRAHAREQNKSTYAHAQNKTVNQVHVHTMHVCGPKNPHIYDTQPRMKNPNGFLSIQLGIGWLAGRLRPVSVPAS
jgi:hypothetical protein